MYVSYSNAGQKFCEGQNKIIFNFTLSFFCLLINKLVTKRSNKQKKNMFSSYLVHFLLITYCRHYKLHKKQK